ncbi:MAG: glycosyltransferase family 4 protein [Planctomycetota bacterium]
MKILHVLAERGFSGGEVQLRHLLKYLSGRGYTQELVLIEDARFRAVARDLDLKIHTVNLRDPVKPDVWRRMRRALHDSKPDVVHFGCGRSLLWGGLMTAGIRGPKRVTTRRIDYPIGGGLRAMRYRHLVHHVAVNCRAVYDRVRGAGVPAERVTLVYEGVEVAAWQGLRKHRELSRIRLDLPKGAVVISQAATLTPRKGQICLLEAFANVADEFPDALLVLAGGGSDLPRLRWRAAELGVQGKVRMPGPIRPIRDLYAATDVFCMSSFHEGLANACLEASAAGLPQIVSAVGGLPEIVADGVTGAVVPAGDVEALALALRRYLADEELRRVAGAAGAERTSQLFTVKNMTEGMESLFRKVVDGSACSVLEA